MEYRVLGSTGLAMSEVGFGTWPIGGTKARNDYGVVDDEQAIQAIRHALGLGITVFDTAPAYGFGRGEEVLARGLGSARKDVVIVTKCAVQWDDTNQTWLRLSTYGEIVMSAEASLRRLKTDYIDVLLRHLPDPDRSPEEPMRAFEDLKRAGKVRYAGVSNFSLEQLKSYLDVGPVNAQQVSIHMFDRRMEADMLAFCHEQGVGVMAFGSLAHGLLTGTFTAETRFETKDWRSTGDSFGLPLFKEGNFQRNVAVVERLKEFARERGHTVAQLAVAWVLRRPEVSVALTGARRPEEIDDNAGGTGWTLSKPELNEIESIMLDAAGTAPEPDLAV